MIIANHEEDYTDAEFRPTVECKIGPLLGLVEDEIKAADCRGERSEIAGGRK